MRTFLQNIRGNTIVLIGDLTKILNNTIMGVTETSDGLGYGWFGNQPTKSVGVRKITEK